MSKSDLARAVSLDDIKAEDERPFRDAIAAAIKERDRARKALNDANAAAVSSQEEKSKRYGVLVEAEEARDDVRSRDVNYRQLAGVSSGNLHSFELDKLDEYYLQKEGRLRDPIFREADERVAAAEAARHLAYEKHREHEVRVHLTERDVQNAEKALEEAIDVMMSRSALPLTVEIEAMQIAIDKKRAELLFLAGAMKRARSSHETTGIELNRVYEQLSLGWRNSVQMQSPEFSDTEPRIKALIAERQAPWLAARETLKNNPEAPLPG